MKGLLLSEWLKVRTTRLGWGLAAGGLALVALYVTILTLAGASSSGSSGPGGNFTLSDPASIRTIYGVPFEVGFVIPLVMGITMISGEFRHQTITPTLLATPRRSRVLVAKGVVAAGIGLVLGLLMTAVTVGLGGLLIAVKHHPVLLGSHGIPRLLVVMVAGLGVWGVFGLGFGALLKNQVAAIVTALALMLIVDNLLAAGLRQIHLGWLAAILPSSASSAIVQPSTTSASNLLPWWGGGLALLGWGIGTAALGSLLTLRRDVT